MIGWLATFIAGDGLKAITEQLGNWHQRKLDAANEHERLEADMAISALEARRAVLVAEAQHKINLWFRGFIALGPALYVFSYFAIDKVICPKTGLDLIWPEVCRVPPIDDPVMKTVMAAVLGFYFVTAIFERR
jgi:hypothetical protein